MHVELHLPGVQGGDHGEAAGGKEDGIAVRRGIHGELGGDQAVGAGAVFDEKVLAHALLERVREQPGLDIRPAARRKRHQDAHRPVGPLLGGCLQGDDGQDGGCSRQRADGLDHRDLLGQWDAVSTAGHASAKPGKRRKRIARRKTC
ncbi:hypothetical protein D3C83_22610 [compost metagenome]